MQGRVSGFVGRRHGLELQDQAMGDLVRRDLVPPSRSEWALTASAEAALAVVRAIATDNIRVEAVEGGRVLLSVGHSEPTHHAWIEVRPREDGSTVVASYAGTRASVDEKKALALGILYVSCGLVVDGPPVVAGGVVMLAVLALWRVLVARRRRADFVALLTEVDRVCRPLKVGETGGAYRVGAPPAPNVPEDRSGRRRR